MEGRAAAGARAAASDIPPVVAGYTLVRVIGRGGMGVVWEAIEHRFDRRVALKVHLPHVWDGTDTHVWSEARLAAQVADPGIVGVHDLGKALDGSPYYTMDLIDGTDLSALLREGPLPQARALAIGAQISRAVAAAHERGIAHRDLKPRNVLIDDHGRARVLDFGLAHGVSGTDRFENSVFGTPAYMAPEQVMALAVGPAADIHAIGVMLYEMLTGQRPFTGEGPKQVMDAIALRAAEPPTTKNPAIHVDVEKVILRCLEKDPEARFPFARKLVHALEALLEGRPLDATIPPPARRTTVPIATKATSNERDLAPVHHRWSWKLRSSPSKLWPLVANTERVNQAIGLPEIEFSDEPDGEGASVRTARSRVLGMEMAWREHPFDWVKDREHSVFRKYMKGPLEAMWNRVQLVPLEGGGTELVHEIWLVPRHLLGRMAASWEMSQKIGKNLDRLYQRLDAAILERVDGPGSDAFEAPFEPTVMQSSHADRIARQLVELGFDAAMVKRVVNHLLYQPTKLLERIRPYALADPWGMPRNDMLTLFLHGANLGLVEIAWDLICPRCLAPHESLVALACVQRQGACVPCGRSYARDLRESVELVFRPHPVLREATATTYCAGAPALRPHILVQQGLSPGETRTLEIELARGDYRVVASRVLQPFTFSASTAGYKSDLDLSIDHDVVDARPSVVRSGPVRVTMANTTTHDQIVRIELASGRTDGVTAADVLTLPDFRDLFSDEMLAEGEHMTVSRMAFLFLDLVDRADLLSRLGDAGAWTVLRKLDALVDQSLRSHHGASVPASLDAHMAAFNTSESAVAAAIALARASAELGEPLRIAVHDGQCIALTRSGRTEYFGKTLHRGMALLEEAPVGGVALSAAVASERSVAEALSSAGVNQEVALTAEGSYKGTRIIRLALQQAS
jgi:serine/threonine protein kinase